MGGTRRDSNGRTLRKGEMQRKDNKRYVYAYTDIVRKRHYVYANTLMELREKEKKFERDRLDGIDSYAASQITILQQVEKYLSLKNNLGDYTLYNYRKSVDAYIRHDDFGQRKLITVKYSDVKAYYLHLVNDRQLSISSVSNVHNILHPALRMAVRDDIIRKNPSDEVLGEIKRSCEKSKQRLGLTTAQREALFDYMLNNPVYCHWWAIFMIMMGTGTRYGECASLQWEDVDFDKRLIRIHNNVTFYPDKDGGHFKAHIGKTKTEAGTRTVPMPDIVYDAFQVIIEEQKETGRNKQVIDGKCNFVFRNRFGTIPNRTSLNRALDRMTKDYNNEEVQKARAEKREPIIIPHFSCHNLRHTYVTILEHLDLNYKTFKTLSGHTAEDMTYDVYVDPPTDEEIRQVGEKLNDVLK